MTFTWLLEWYFDRSRKQFRKLLLRICVMFVVCFLFTIGFILTNELPQDSDTTIIIGFVTIFIFMEGAFLSIVYFIHSLIYFLKQENECQLIIVDDR
jgi:hypothetical protein